VRHLESGETLPVELGSGMELLKLDKDWVWLYEDDGIKAGLIAAPAHGIVHLLRIFAVPNAPRWAILLLLREAKREVKARGYTGVIVFLEVGRDTDTKLAKIAGKFGLVGVNRLGFWCAGSL
jgi:hypothetical protein